MKKIMMLTVAVLSFALLIGGAGLAASAADDNSPGASSSDSSGSDSKAKAKKGHAGPKGNVHVNVIKVAASVLGKTEDEVKEAVKTGKVGDLLIAAGKVDGFKAAYLAELKSKLDKAMAAGTLTQAQADEKYARGKEKMDAYDGTSHLCGGKDHSRMFEKKGKAKSGSASGGASSAADAGETA